MKVSLLFIFTILATQLLAQTVFRGTVLDSISKEPLPFTHITIDNREGGTASNFDGNFQFDKVEDSIVTLTVTAVGYSIKKIKAKVTPDALEVLLTPDDESFFIISSQPTDTIFYDNGSIKTIKYRGHNEEQFYPNGQLKYKSANGSTRSWFENGQVKHQSISKSSHLHKKTEWYQNGQKKAEGTMYWGNDEKQNKGVWIESSDWRYWTRKGREKNINSK